MNACHNALDVHIENGHGDESAYVFANRYTEQITEHTYKELYEKVGRMGQSLTYVFGMKKGDKALLYTTNIFESVVVSLALARIGCIHLLRGAGDDAKDFAN